MAWIDALDNITHAFAANALIYNLGDEALHTSNDPTVVSHYSALISMPPLLSQYIASSVLDALEFPETDEKVVSGFIPAMNQLALSCFALIAQIHDSEPGTAPFTIPNNKSLINQLNDPFALGHDTSRKLRIGLYQNISALFSREDFERYAWPLTEALGITKIIDGRTPTLPSAFPIFEMPLNTALYGDALLKIMLTAGRCERDRDSYLFDTGDAYVLRDSHLQTTLLESVAGQAEDLWTEQTGFEAAARLNGVLIILVSDAIDVKKRPVIAMSSSVKGMVMKAEITKSNAAHKLLEDCARAYHQAMPHITATYLSNRIGASLRQKCGARLWNDDATVVAYVENLLTPYFEGRSLRPTVYDSTVQRPS